MELEFPNGLTLEDCEMLLEDYCGVSSSTIAIVEDINGRNFEALEDLLYEKVAYRDFEDLVNDINEGNF